MSRTQSTSRSSTQSMTESGGSEERKWPMGLPVLRASATVLSGSASAQQRLWSHIVGSPKSTMPNRDHAGRSNAHIGWPASESTSTRLPFGTGPMQIKSGRSSRDCRSSTSAYILHTQRRCGRPDAQLVGVREPLAIPPAEPACRGSSRRNVDVDRIVEARALLVVAAQSKRVQGLQTPRPPEIKAGMPGRALALECVADTPAPVKRGRLVGSSACREHPQTVSRPQTRARRRERSRSCPRPLRTAAQPEWRLSPMGRTRRRQRPRRVDPRALRTSTDRRSARTGQLPQGGRRTPCHRPSEQRRRLSRRVLGLGRSS